MQSIVINHHFLHPNQGVGIYIRDFMVVRKGTLACLHNSGKTTYPASDLSRSISVYQSVNANTNRMLINHLILNLLKLFMLINIIIQSTNKPTNWHLHVS